MAGQRDSHRRTRRTWWKWPAAIIGVIVVVNVLATVVGGDDDTPSTSSGETVQRPITLQGRGIQATRGFRTSSSSWQMCARLSTSSDEVYGSFVVYPESEEIGSGRSVGGGLRFTGGDGDQQCTVVRAAPGRYYVSAIAGGADWTITIGPP